jgi:hypothetical protein
MGIDQSRHERAAAARDARQLRPFGQRDDGMEIARIVLPTTSTLRDGETRSPVPPNTRTFSNGTADAGEGGCRARTGDAGRHATPK